MPGKSLDLDAGGRPIYPPPVPGGSATIQLDFTDATARVAVAANTLYLVKATEDCYYLTGTVAVEASPTTSATAGSHLLFAGEAEIVDTGTGTYIAAIRRTTSGQLTCAPLKG